MPDVSAIELASCLECGAPVLTGHLHSRGQMAMRVVLDVTPVSAEVELVAWLEGRRSVELRRGASPEGTFLHGRLPRDLGSVQHQVLLLHACGEGSGRAVPMAVPTMASPGPVDRFLAEHASDQPPF